ncbi:hypothetical protein FXO38_01640 [Capsicum annuum]|nr:hypothetical protein FXO38_01640 [Capsicum annuum]KAF3683960.1 hypothetical protein FXO37_01590 [Capsicum annuum]
MPRAPLNQNQPIQIDDVEGEGFYGSEGLDETTLFVKFMRNRRRAYGGGHGGRGGKVGPAPHGRGNLRHRPHVQEGLVDQGGNMGRDTGLNSIKITLPSFKGTSDPSLYLDWELQCNHIFQLNELTSQKKAAHTIAQFEGYASTWWETKRLQWERNDNLDLSDWDELKALMKERYVTKRYPRLESTSSSTPNPKGIVCFKYQDWGHKASECPNRNNIVLVEDDPYFIGDKVTKNDISEGTSQEDDGDDGDPERVVEKREVNVPCGLMRRTPHDDAWPEEGEIAILWHDDIINLLQWGLHPMKFTTKSRFYEKIKEWQHTGSNSFESMLQTILDRVTTMGENVHDLRQSNEAFGREIVQMEKVGKEINLTTTTTLPISQEEVNQEEKSSYDDELGASEEASSEVGVRPHSNHFLIFCLEDVRRIHPPRQMMNCGEKEDHPYILGFDTPKEHMEAPPSMAKELNFQCTTSGQLMFLPLPKEPNQKFDVKLGKRVSSCTHMTIVIDLQWIVACILSGITLNMGEIVLLKWRHFKNHRGTLLLFPFLITKLCKRANVEEYSIDTWVYPGPCIFLLKFQDEGSPGWRVMMRPLQISQLMMPVLMVQSQQERVAAEADS